MIKRSRISLNRIIYPNLKLKDFFKFVKDLGLNKIELRNDLPGVTCTRLAGHIESLL